MRQPELSIRFTGGSNLDKQFKRILMTTDNLGGIWRYTIELVSELNQAGIKTALAVMGSPLSEDQRKEVTQLHNVILYESKYKLEWMEDPWEEVDEAGEWLLNIRDEFHPDIIHLNSYSFGSLNWGLPVLIVAHSDVLSWWKSVLNRPHPKRFNEYQKRVRFGLQNADYLVAPSNTMLRYINDIYGTFGNQQVIYNGRNPKHFKIGNKENFIFSIGRVWDTAKNISLIVNSAPMLKWKVKLAGNLQNPATEEVSVYGNVEFFGNLSASEINKFLSAASIFVLPAKYEPFGLSALEAALSGCVLVLGSIDSLKEIWGDSALYVNPDDSNELVQVINSIISDELMLNKYARKVYKKAQDYSTENMFSEYIKIYNTLIEKKISINNS